MFARIFGRLSLVQRFARTDAKIEQITRQLQRTDTNIEQITRQLQRTDTNIEQITRQLQSIREIIVEESIDNLLNSDKYQQNDRLNRYEKQIYSQSGEDGIIHEIFDRVGLTNRFFVEFGVGNGEEFDLLSIDIDGNDYWVWKAIKKFRPRVVVIEYNASFPPPTRLVMKYQANRVWDSTSYFGASLKSLELLGASKGYNLVGCGITGVNAFFVRSDLCGDRFTGPYTAECLYEPPRYFLLRRVGHKRGVGEFEHI